MLAKSRLRKHRYFRESVPSLIQWHNSGSNDATEVPEQLDNPNEAVPGTGEGVGAQSTANTLKISKVKDAKTKPSESSTTSQGNPNYLKQVRDYRGMSS